MKLDLRYLLLLGGILAYQPLYALGTSDFSFVAGDSSSQYSYKGKPLASYSIADQLPRDVLDNVYSMLPEGSQVNSDYIAPERYSSIDIDDELNGAEYAEVSVTFLNEGAGYRNSLGYIIYPTDTPPQSVAEVDTHWIIFPNASKPREGEMREGDTLDLNIQVSPGHTLAFFVIPNGWGYSGSYNNINSLGNWNTPFYSLPSLNPESTLANRRHNVAFVDVSNEFLVLGFEDICRPDGDNDFNDLLFTVNVTPFTAIDGVNLDGSTSSRYEPLTQINEPDLLITSVYPASDQYATLAFEDCWPEIGDYDFNDVVWQYRVTERLNGQRELTGFTYDLQLQAMGGSYHNGFAIHLPTVSTDQVAEATLTYNDEIVSREVLQSHGSQAVFVISEDIRTALLNLNALDEECTFYRTQAGCLDQQTQTLNYQLEVTLQTPVPRAAVGYPPYDPFIFSAEHHYHGDHTLLHPGIGWQTHLKQHSGTTQIHSGLFNSVDDASSGSNYFVNERNMPWAINIGESWQHPLERVDLNNAYRQFENWVVTSGEQNSDWYKPSNARTNKTATNLEVNP